MLGSLKARKPEVWKAAPIMRRLKEQMGEKIEGERKKAIRIRISEFGMRNAEFGKKKEEGGSSEAPAHS
jgi:hypothetical protein